MGEKHLNWQSQGFVSQEQYDEALKALQSGREGKSACGGSQGCEISAAEQENLDERWGIVSNYKTWVELGKATSTHCGYPESCFLADGIPGDVFDQGGRGTCMAQALAAFGGYYFGGQKVFSPEYIYAKLISMKHDSFADRFNAFFQEHPKPPMPNEIPNRNEAPIKYASEVPWTSDEDLLKRWGDFFQREAQKEMARKRAKGKVSEDDEIVLDLGKIYSEYKQELQRKDPFNRDGVSISDAENFLRNDGFCSYRVWPYSQENIEGNSGHLPIPAEAERDASRRRVTGKVKTLTGGGGNVDEIKRFLCGDNGRYRPMPVCVGLLTFNSWKRSSFAKRTGWVNMPVYDDVKIFAFLLERLCPEIFNAIKEKCTSEGIPVYPMISRFMGTADGKTFIEQHEEEFDQIREEYLQYGQDLLEDSNEGHAMLVVGYQDEPRIPGGGYFLVRNSWGPGWAFEGEHPGHAKVPYAYFRQFCYAGVSVVELLKQNGDVEKRTPSVEGTPSSPLSKQTAEAGNELKMGFLECVKSNLNQLDKPSLQQAGLLLKFTAWLSLKQVKEACCRNGEHGPLVRLWARGVARQAPEILREATEQASGIDIYELKCGAHSILLLAAYLCPIGKEGPIPMKHAHLDVLRQIADEAGEFAAKRYGAKVEAVGVVLGTRPSVFPEYPALCDFSCYFEGISPDGWTLVASHLPEVASHQSPATSEDSSSSEGDAGVEQHISSLLNELNALVGKRKQILNRIEWLVEKIKAETETGTREIYAGQIRLQRDELETLDARRKTLEHLLRNEQSLRMAVEMTRLLAQEHSREDLEKIRSELLQKLSSQISNREIMIDILSFIRGTCEDKNIRRRLTDILNEWEVRFTASGDKTGNGGGSPEK